MKMNPAKVPLRAKTFVPKLPASIVLTAGIGLFASSPVFSETKRQLESHLHGAANMDIVFEGKNIAILLETPAVNLVGFEWAPKNEEERAQIDDTKTQLSRLNNLVALPANAGCTVSSVTAQWVQETDHHDGEGHAEHEEHHDEDEHEEHEEHEKHHDEDEHGEHDDAAHSEFHVEYLIQCNSIDEVQSLEVRLFDLYPELEEISVQAVLPEGQTALSLTPENNLIQVTP